MDKVIVLILIGIILSLIYAHHQTQIQVVECTDGTFTELHVFERFRQADPAYIHTMTCTYRVMSRGDFYDERSLRSYIKR